MRCEEGIWVPRGCVHPITPKSKRAHMHVGKTNHIRRLVIVQYTHLPSTLYQRHRVRNGAAELYQRRSHASSLRSVYRALKVCTVPSKCMRCHQGVQGVQGMQSVQDLRSVQERIQCDRARAHEPPSPPSLENTDRHRAEAERRANTLPARIRRRL
ncbi:MAG: hypothetical protein FE78DRAFT_524504 [Acidomyces sp. 'richmondensis']|nr:MAG: hypothetical protein FE78DRAFT_524504 [Acidomyces sp. 'richmondensis']